MTEDEPGAGLRSVAAHPYLLAADGASGAEPIRRPMPAAEVLDLGFGVTDGLVELHSRGLAHGRIGPSSLVSTPGGGLSLVLPTAAAGAGEASTDVDALKSALLQLLPAGSDPLTDGTRSVLADPSLTTAPGLRDALASVRLGELPPRSSTAGGPSTVPVIGAVGAGVRVSQAGDSTPLQARQGPRDPDNSPASPLQPRSAALVALVAIAVLIVVAAAVFLVLR